MLVRSQFRVEMSSKKVNEISKALENSVKTRAVPSEKSVRKYTSFVGRQMEYALHSFLMYNEQPYGHFRWLPSVGLASGSLKSSIRVGFYPFLQKGGKSGWERNYKEIEMSGHLSMNEYGYGLSKSLTYTSKKATMHRTLVRWIENKVNLGLMDVLNDNIESAAYAIENYWIEIGEREAPFKFIWWDMNQNPELRRYFQLYYGKRKGQYVRDIANSIIKNLRK